MSSRPVHVNMWEKTTLLFHVCFAVTIICVLAEDTSLDAGNFTKANVTNNSIDNPDYVITTNNSIDNPDYVITTNNSIDNPTVDHKGCKLKVEFHPEEYIQFENGSVYIPAYKLTPDILDYEAFNSSIFVCWKMNYSKEFIECELKLVYESDEYVTFKNGSIHIEQYSRVYDLQNHHKIPNGSILCQPLESKHHPDYAFIYLSSVTTGISIAFLILHLLVFLIVPDIRNLPGYCLASLCVALLSAFSSFRHMSTASPEQCRGTAVSIYYFFLASFFWMNAISFEITRILWRASTKLRSLSKWVDWKRFFAYSLYAWLTPLIFITVALIADKSDNFPDSYRPNFGKGVCWFNNGKALLVFFAVPQFVIIVGNVCLFVFAAVVIQRHRMRNKDNTKDMVRKFWLFSRLAVIMGLGWILGLVAGYADNVPLWYIFVIVNALQGLFIFLSFSCNTKVLNHFRQKFPRIFCLKFIPGRHSASNTDTCSTEGGIKSVSLANATAFQKTGKNDNRTPAVIQNI